MQLKFVGRSSELRELDAITRNSAAGRGALVVISGEPGIGKSRLIREFIDNHPDDLIVTAAAHTSDQTPFATFADIVAALDRKGISVEKCEATTAARERAKNPEADAPPPVDPNEPLGDTANRLLELINLSPSPPILIIEQIQFMDPDSVRLLNHLAFALTNEAITIICTRSTDRAGKARVDVPPQGVDLELRGLTMTEVEELVALQNPGLEPDEMAKFARSLHQTTAGYPRAIHDILESMGTEIPTEHQLLAIMVDTADNNSAEGNIEIAQAMYSRVADLAEHRGDLDALVEAILGLTFPPDWRIGNAEALARIVQTRTVLDSVEAADSPTKVILDSMRAMLEMRIPQQASDGRQWAWVTRPDAAQPLSAETVNRARDLDNSLALLTALTSWRWTHRGPTFLATRSELSAEALDLALVLDRPDFLIEACVRNVVDALEQGDRQVAEKSIAVAQWVADQTQDPRIQWRAAILSAAPVGLDGNWEQYAELRKQAMDFGFKANLPGTVAMDAVFQVQYLIHTLDFSEWDWSNPLFTKLAKMHPLSSATWAFGLAYIDQNELASEWIKNTLSILDEESSLIASLTLLGFAAVKLRDIPTASEILRLLGPWSGRIALDADAGIIVGPVDLALARLCDLVGETDRAKLFARTGNALKQQLTGEVSNLDRLIPLAETDSKVPELTERETSILKLVGQGMTNQEIASNLSFSLATVRRDTISLYKKLGVRGRAGAVQKAVGLGLLN